MYGVGWVGHECQNTFYRLSAAAFCVPRDTPRPSPAPHARRRQNQAREKISSLVIRSNSSTAVRPIVSNTEKSSP